MANTFREPLRKRDGAKVKSFSNRVSRQQKRVHYLCGGYRFHTNSVYRCTEHRSRFPRVLIVFRSDLNAIKKRQTKSYCFKIDTICNPLEKNTPIKSYTLLTIISITDYTTTTVRGRNFVPTTDNETNYGTPQQTTSVVPSRPTLTT